MKKFTSLFSVAVCLLVSGNSLQAQMVGSDIFLKGTFLEIGQNDFGAFGSTGSAPSGYHPAPAGSLAEVYDYGLDGWATGTPPYFGDYTLPVYPFEGWGLQINGELNWALTTRTIITGPGSLMGHNISYMAAGDSVVAEWAGTAAGGAVTIYMQTRINTNSSWAVMNVRMYNMSGAAKPGVYFVRTCNPQNDQTHSGNPATYNTISYQNDTAHRVLVSSTGTADTNAYLGLGTRGNSIYVPVAFIYDSLPLNAYVTDLAAVYNGTAHIAPVYTVGGRDSGDHGIGLVFNLGTIASGDSAIFSYSYIFSKAADIDTAFMMDSSITIPPTVTGHINNLTGIQLFPNPAFNELTITSAYKITSINITNLLGQIVYNHVYNAEKVQVHVADLPSGMYFVKINGLDVRKFIKQ